MQTVSLGIPPWGPYNFIIKRANNTGLWEQEFNEAGYEVDVKATWEDATLFAAGKTQFSAISTLEAQSLARKNDRNLTVFGQQVLPPHGYIVQKGGPYDTDKTGSIQASLDKIVEDNAKFAIGSWSAGSLPYGSFAIQDQWGYKLGKEGDFNVTVVKYGAMPKLLMQGELAVIANSPMHGAAPQLMNDKATALWWDMDLWSQEYGMLPPLGNFITDTSFLQDNVGAARALLNVYVGAVKYIKDNVTEMAQKDFATEVLPVNNTAQAEFAVKAAFFEEDNPLYSQAVMPTNPAMTPEVQESNKNFMKKAVQIGMAKEGWNQYLKYRHVKPDV